MKKRKSDDDEVFGDDEAPDPVMIQKRKEAYTASLVKKLKLQGLEEDEIATLLPTDKDKESFLREAFKLSANQDDSLCQVDDDSDDEEDKGEISETDARDVKLRKAAIATVKKLKRKDKEREPLEDDIDEEESNLALKDLNANLPEGEKISPKEWLQALEGLEDIE